jgi:carbonic anhydrase/acetyltransferase-like protein (isoleucine patch superfamily)
MVAAKGGVAHVSVLGHHGVMPKIHPTAFIAGGAWVIGDVQIGDQAGIWFNAVLRGDINRIVVGDRSNIQDGAVLHVTRELPALVANDVTVGHKAMIHACTIEDACLIGMNAVVLDGARVGPFSIVAAGAVVREGAVVPEGMLVAGVPARVVRPLSAEEKQHLLQSAKNYIEYARTFQE